jgi:hydroxymethylpyrimidine pyrophosphatase-like HAD family hydrolase
MIYVFDLDGTLCENAKDGQSVYEVRPFPDRILLVNKLYDEGHTIMIDTARGSRTGLPHQEKTEEQLKRWGIKYHQLRTGTKFFGHFYVDDKGLGDKEFFTQMGVV